MFLSGFSTQMFALVLVSTLHTPVDTRNGEIDYVCCFPLATGRLRAKHVSYQQ